MLGTTLSHYRITEKLGAGGMGEVYRAEDTNLNRQVAIKVLPEIISGDPERMARFEREARVLASLMHPNIASIHELEESGGKRFIVMELVEGEMLAARLDKGPIPLEESLEIARQIAKALAAAHEQGISHRDLKPANIKITPEGKVKVLDFGLAKVYAGDAASASGTAAGLSAAHVVEWVWHTDLEAKKRLRQSHRLSPGLCAAFLSQTSCLGSILSMGGQGSVRGSDKADARSTM